MQNNLVLLNEKQKKPLAEQSVLHTVLPENEAQINKQLQNYAFHGQTSHDQPGKISSILQETEHRAKAINAEIEHRIRKRSHELDRIGVERIRTFSFLPFPLTTQVLIH